MNKARFITGPLCLIAASSLAFKPDIAHTDITQSLANAPSIWRITNGKGVSPHY